MADIPPITDATTERNHSRDGGEDQQQSAVLPPSPPDTPGNQVAAGVTATANASSAEQPGANGGADPPAPPPSGPATYSSSAAPTPARLQIDRSSIMPKYPDREEDVDPSCNGLVHVVVYRTSAASCASVAPPSQFSS